MCVKDYESEIERLAKEVLDSYINLLDDSKNENNDCNGVILLPPILYFGNLKEYCNSNPRIVTVGINPSFNEYKRDMNCNSFSVYRFKEWNKCNGRNNCFTKEYFVNIAKCLKNDIDTYLTGLNNYFNINPYNSWFKSHLKGFIRRYILRCDNKYLSVVYNIDNNNFIHIDYCTPIATSPEWSKLRSKCKEELKNISNDVFERLIDILEPHWIIVAPYHIDFFEKDSDLKIKSNTYVFKERYVKKERKRKKEIVIYERR